MSGTGKMLGLLLPEMLRIKRILINFSHLLKRTKKRKTKTQMRRRLTSVMRAHTVYRYILCKRKEGNYFGISHTRTSKIWTREYCRKQNISRRYASKV